MTPAELVRRKLDDQRRIVEAILADFVVDLEWTRGRIRHMVVVHSVAGRLGVRQVGYPFMRRVYAACRRLGACRVKPHNKALWRGLRRRE